MQWRRKKLDRWHWVTIIALEYTKNGDHALVSILDNGEIIDIDLALWYKTTTKGGGFVYIEGKEIGKRVKQ